MEKITDPFNTPMSMKTYGELKEAAKALLVSLYPGKDPETLLPMFTIPVAWGPARVKDSITGKCEKCDQDVWLSPSSLRVREKCIIICSECVVKQLEV